MFEMSCLQGNSNTIQRYLTAVSVYFNDNAATTEHISLTMSPTSTRCAQDCSLGAKIKGPNADSGGWVLGEGAATPPHHLGAVSSSSGVRA